MHFLLICTFTWCLFIKASLGVRMVHQAVTTAHTLPVNNVSHIPITALMSQEIPTLPPPQTCSDALNGSNPLGKLRSAMRNLSYTQLKAYLDAFLVFYTDEHLNEEPAPDERRLEYISGWGGMGTGVVLADGGAAIWVPSGEVRRARETLSCAWQIFDSDSPSQQTIVEWIAEHPARNGRVGGDARLTSFLEWQMLYNGLQQQGLQLLHVPTLLDQLWKEETNDLKKRPSFSQVVAMTHPMEYAGLSWRDKVYAVRSELHAIGADAMVVTALDEVAWLLNIRGRDVPFAPLFKAFVILGLRDIRVYAPAGKLMMPQRDALDVYASNCGPMNNCTKIYDYPNIYSDLRRASESKILIPSGGTFQRGASAAIAQSVPQIKQIIQPSPIMYLKAQKNAAEIRGMKKAHLKDAVAMCSVLSYLESLDKTSLTELSVGLKIDVTRVAQAGHLGLSMPTRVAFGPNGAEPEYRPTNISNKRISNNSTLVIQSGGQYIEGTTVVSRTVHYGKPSVAERRAYSVVLRALAAMSSLQVPGTLPAAHADPVARAPLWPHRQDAPAPTGHGVGAALTRREDPVVIDYRQDANLHTFREGYFITSEPSWYEPGKFGVKLGNILEVVARQGTYLGFREATLVPYEPKLIDKKLLTDYEINWLNSYNDQIRKTVGPELKMQGLMDVYYWMMNKTVHIDLAGSKKYTNTATCNSLNFKHIVIVFIFMYIM